MRPFSRRRHRVVLQTMDGQTLRGILVGEYRRDVALRHAEHIEDGQNPAALAGTVVVPRENVSFFQVVGE